MVNLHCLTEVGNSGIHTICIGICMRLQAEGFKVGFMKPLGFRAMRDEEVVTDVDAKFLRDLLGLDDALTDMCPIFLTPHIIQQALTGTGEDFPHRVERAYKNLAEGKDALVLQGALTAPQGALLNLSGYDLNRLLDSQVILVERYDDAFQVDNVLEAKHHFGDNLLGVIFNMIPPLRKSFVDELVRPYLENHGIPMLGGLPEDRILKSTSIRDLAATLQGQVLTGESHLDDLVENVMVGAMSQEHALSFFRKRFNQVIVTGGDRSDIQLAALEANARCIILSGNLYPSRIIMSKAEELNVPLILVEDDTLTAAEKAELLIRSARTHETKKLERLRELMEMYVDFDRLYRLSGLK